MDIILSSPKALLRSSTPNRFQPTSSTKTPTLHHFKPPSAPTLLHLMAKATPSSNIFGGRSSLTLHSPAKKSRDSSSVVVGAGGPPSTSVLIFAFAFPLSLVIVTVFAAIRVADKLDQQYLEELAINQAIMEEEDCDEDDVITIPMEEEPSVPRSRNRPKREA